VIAPLPSLQQWPTSSLVDRFVEILSPFGTMPMGDFVPIAGVNNNSDEYLTAAKEARAIAEELNRRADREAGDLLWRCDNPAVRMGMFKLLLPDTPSEVRFAAMLGPLSGLPDEAAGELYLRALATGEERVPLRGLTDDELMDRFEEFCLRDFMGTTFFNLHSDQEQIDARNNVLAEIWRILTALKDRGALARLLPLLKYENQNIRLWAANGALFIDEDAALATLSAIAEEGTPKSARMILSSGPGLPNMSAMSALEQWRKERRGIYGLNPGDNRDY
jgi:hypothetical protein